MTVIISSVVTDSESEAESANFPQIRPNPNQHIFFKNPAETDHLQDFENHSNTNN